MRKIAIYLGWMFLLSSCSESTSYYGKYDSLFIDDMFVKDSLSQRKRETLEKLALSLEISKEKIIVYVGDEELFSGKYEKIDRVFVVEGKVAEKKFYHTLYLDGSGIFYYMSQRFVKRKSNS